MHSFNKHTLIFVICSTLLGACSTPQQKLSGDDAIRRVESCTCYTSTEGQKLSPWELGWDDPEKLRMQFSHCICQAHIDIRTVENPTRYIVPGTVVK